MYKVIHYDKKNKNVEIKFCAQDAFLEPPYELFQKRYVRTKLDIYVFIASSGTLKIEGLKDNKTKGPQLDGQYRLRSSMPEGGEPKF
jgi:hypothetical protein